MTALAAPATVEQVADQLDAIAARLTAQVPHTAQTRQQHARDIRDVAALLRDPDVYVVTAPQLAGCWWDTAVTANGGTVWADVDPTVRAAYLDTVRPWLDHLVGAGPPLVPAQRTP